MPFVRPILLAAILAGASAAVPARSQAATCAPPVAMETAVLHFQITEERFAAFRDVASYRKSRRLNVLPGFPEDPNLDRSVAELAGDAGTLERLERAGLSPRDYVLTGWALITAHDPGDWGLTDRRMTGEMRRNIRFVQEHAPSVDALLQGE